MLYVIENFKIFVYNKMCYETITKTTVLPRQEKGALQHVKHVQTKLGSLS